MNADLRTALVTSNDCTCTRWVDSDGDERRPRSIRERDLDCPDHGVNAAHVLPPAEDEQPTPAEPPRVVVDAATVLGKHREWGQSCSCGNWPDDVEFEEHLAQALNAAGLLGYAPRPVAPWFQQLMDDAEVRTRA